MLISYSHKFIFIHICHTAGTSVKSALEDYATEPEKFKINRPKRTIEGKANPIYNMWKATLYHASAQEIQRELPKHIYDTFYKFAFVRHPLDRLVSSYHHILKDTWSRHHKTVNSMKTFDEFVDWSTSNNNYPQKDFVTDDDGNVIVDFIGRHERLVDDFNLICKTIGINTSLSHLNNTNHRDYRTYYNQDTMRKIVKLFKDDIEFFGYREQENLSK